MEQGVSEEASQGHNAVGPGEKSLNFTVQQWEQWANSNLEDFFGNKANTSRLLFEATQGMKYVRDKLEGKGLSNLRLPTLVVLVKEEGPNPIGHTSGFVFIKKSFLEEYSNLTMNDAYTVTRADGDVAYQGTIPNLFRLAGVEESHHEIFEQCKNKQNGNDPLLQTIAEYDAKDHEYRALRMQLRHAIESGMQNMTVAKLQDRAAKAQEVRQQRPKTS